MFMVDSAGGASRGSAYPKVQKQLFQMLGTDWCRKLSNLKIIIMANKQDFVSQIKLKCHAANHFCILAACLCCLWCR